MQWAIVRTINTATHTLTAWRTPKTTQEKPNHTHPAVVTSTHVGKNETVVTQHQAFPATHPHLPPTTPQRDKLVQGSHKCPEAHGEPQEKLIDSGRSGWNTTSERKGEDEPSSITREENKRNIGNGEIRPLHATAPLIYTDPGHKGGNNAAAQQTGEEKAHTQQSNPHPPRPPPTNMDKATQSSCIHPTSPSNGHTCQRR